MDQHIPSRGEGRVAIHPVAYVTETMMVGTLKGGNVCPLNLETVFCSRPKEFILPTQ